MISCRPKLRPPSDPYKDTKYSSCRVPEKTPPSISLKDKFAKGLVTVKRKPKAQTKKPKHAFNIKSVDELEAYFKGL